jgi:PAS domain S-box-containing protein
MTLHAGHTKESKDNPAKVLVVDDDERNLLALSEVLSPLAEVVTASSGRDALRLLLRQEFAVILLDVFMPGLDGYETAALIREREQTARIPIIFLSAVNKETEHLMRGYEMGAVDYVFKPVDPLILKSKVSVFVDLYKIRDQVEQQALAEQQLREAHYQEQLSRIEVERQLEDVERRQNAIIQSLPIILYTERHDQLPRRPDFVSGNLEEMTGFTFEQVSASPTLWQDRIHPDDRDRVLAALGERGDKGRHSIEYRWQCADGTYKHFHDQAVPLSEGKTTEYAGTLTDVSEQRLLESQLVHVGKLDALGRLTGGVAHDFNNLLAAMLGGLHVLQRRLEIGEREQVVVDQMRHATEQGAELVRRMMAFARQQDLSPSSVDPASLCDSVAGLVNHTLGGTVVVDWQCPDRRLNLFVDRGQLELALMNLIINARDAMPKGGEIKVEIEPAESTAVRQPALRIRISDQGVGIPQELIARVTEPFFTTKETGRGTGLGLSMVAGFVHQSGGELNIESAVGKGTVIDLILPATEAAATSVDTSRTADFSWLADKKLLLIDDDDSVRVVLSEQFRDAGGVVDDYASGHDAIAAVKRDPGAYDYILSDFAMPGIDGLETLRTVRKLAPDARIALMTGYADEALLTGDHQIPLIRKPIDFRKMAAAFEG